MVNEIFDEASYNSLTPSEQQFFISLGEDILDKFSGIIGITNGILKGILKYNASSTIINSSISLNNIQPDEDPYVEVGGVVLQGVGAITLSAVVGFAYANLAGIAVSNIPTLISFSIAGLSTSLVTYVYAQNEQEIENTISNIIDLYGDWGILTADKPFVFFRLPNGQTQEFVLGDSGNNTIIINNDTTLSTSVPFLSSGFSGVENLDGMAGNDSLVGNEFSNELRGNVGNDTLEGNGGADFLVGGLNDDFVSYDYVENGLFDDDKGVFVDLDTDTTGVNGTGRVENDSTDVDALKEIEGVIGSDYNDTLIGSTTNNTLLGGDGDDRLEGISGNNLLSGGKGNNIIVGGTGQDTIDYRYVDSWINNDVIIDLDSGTAEVVYLVDNDNDQFSNVEHVITGGGNDQIKLSSDSNNVDSGDGNDTVFGLLGGEDTLNGGAGNEDYIDYSESNIQDGVRIFLDTNQVFSKTGGMDTLKDSISNFEYAEGTAFDDHITGNESSNLLIGNQGIDIIQGLGGEDTLLGGSHTDTLKGGDDDDSLDGQEANDSLIGEKGEDILLGGSGNDILDGGADTDTLNGGDDNDTIIASEGELEVIDGGSGFNWIDYSSYGNGTDFVNIDLSIGENHLNLPEGETTSDDAKDVITNIEGLRTTNNGDVIRGGFINDIIMSEGGNDSVNGHTGDDEIQGGSGRDTLNGWIGSDVLYGEGGNDSLYGDENDDVLIGGAGNDKLFGGDNSDIYWFGVADGEDTIKDGHGADRIMLYGSRELMVGQADILENNDDWDYILRYGEDADNDNKGDYVAYLRWDANETVPGAIGDLEIDFDATDVYDLVIEDYSNGEFGILLDGAATNLNVEEGEPPADIFFNTVPLTFDEYAGHLGPIHFLTDPDDGEEETEEEVIVVHPWPDGDGDNDDDYFPPIHIGTPSDGDGTWNTNYPDLPGNPVVPGDPLPTVPDPLEPGAASMGDPHLMTYDGKFYDFQDAGEFTLVRSTDANAPFTVQARQKSWDLGDAQGEMFSVNSAIATQLGDYKVGFYLPGSLPYDLAAAQADEFTLNDTLPVLYVGNYPVFMADNAIFTIDGAGSVYRQGDNYMVVNENLDYFTVTVHDTHIDFASGLSGTRTSGSVEGLLGNYDGDASNDFMLDDGTNLGAAIDNNTLYNTFGDDWRITQSESLFLYGEGQNTHSFDNFEFDNQHRTLADFDPAVVSAAQTAVAAEGFDPNSDVFDAAVLDYIVMGSIEYTNMWEALEERSVIDADITNIATNLVEGTVNPDSLIGTAGIDRLAGYEGNDTIKGRADDDTLVGGVGDDLLYGEGGFDTFLHYVGDGSDTLYEDGNSFSAVAMIGVDMEDIYFNVSGDHLIATNTNNSESVTMMWQYDDIAAGLPFGTFNGQSLATSLTIRGTSATAGEVVNGSILADTLIGGLGDDIIYGNGGTNYFIHEVGDGNDHLYDEYNAQSVVTLNGVNQDDLYFNVEGDDLLITDIANDETIRLDRHYYKTDLYGFRFSSLNGEDISGGLLIRGTSATAGEDLVDTEFNDTFEGGLGDDAMWADGGTNHYIHNAGDGNDTIFENRNAMSTVEMNATSADSIYFSVDGSTLVVTNIETGEFLTLRYQYYYSDSTYFSTINGIDVTGGITVKGTSATAAETIEGTSYNDTIIGGLGDDYIITEGQDTITHNIGDGNDLLVGNYGDEAVIEMVGVDAEDIEFYINGTNLQIIDTVNNEVVTLYAQYSYTYNGFRFGSVNGIDLTEGLTLNGDASDNTLNGSLMDEEFNAGAGNDVVYAEKGDDTVYGGTGNDYIFGEDDNDLIMGEEGDDTLRGDDENDTLWGGTGHDSLRGGNHDDVLYGEEGNDTLNGGNGADIFVFGANSGVDLISDFDEGTDLLHFDSGVFATAADAVAAFSSGSIDLGSGNSVTLQGVSTLTEADIVIV